MSLVSVHVSWPYHAGEVIVVGNFCDWEQGKGVKALSSGGGFVATLHVHENSKVVYKFIVDGVWKHDEHAPVESDSSGNFNNFIMAPNALPISHKMAKKLDSPVEKSSVPHPSSTVNTTESLLVAPIVSHTDSPTPGSSTTLSPSGGSTTSGLDIRVPSPPAVVEENKKTIVPVQTERALSPVVTPPTSQGARGCCCIA